MKRYAAHLLLLLLFFSSCLSYVIQAADSGFNLLKKQKDIMTLLSKELPRRNTTDPLSKELPRWNTTDPNPCSWPGVNCSSGGTSSSRVTALSLAGLGLSANSSTFFNTLCRLDSLQSLDLSGNFFTSIPSSFTNCTGLSGLKSLNLSTNVLNGPLPDFSGLPALESLDLSYNRFQGLVNSQLVGLARLKILNLSNNVLEGTIPSVKAVALEQLVLSNNRFDGGIPTEIFQHGNLTVLDLTENNLSGSVPDGIGRLSKLESLLLSANQLIGTIPSSLSNITTLSRFAANQNSFHGSIPTGITTYLKTLDLSYNRLDGEIPSDLLAPPTLESVDLSSNFLAGPIPGNLSGRLYRLRLGGNSLNGSIPLAIGKLSNLTYLELDDNHLEGGIPTQLGSCKNLALLNLASNRLQGELPEKLGSLEQLVVMKLQNNNLNMTIPDLLLRLDNLNTLNLSQNSLTGEIPSVFSSSQKLSILNLEGNKLVGPIPDSISNLVFLIELQLGSNMLNGTIPNMPISLTTALNLSNNLLSGYIPSFLSSLNGLEILDLSNNNITGPVPNSLTQMPSLTQVLLYNNQLSGVLPKFPHYVVVNATGNKDLELNQTVSPGTSVTSSRKKNTVLLVIVAIVSALVGFGLVSAIFLLLVSKRFYRVEDVALQPEENPPQIINGCFLTTNSLHRSSIDFTKAMEAVSNPANIMLKTRFSTYYKAVMPSSVSYSVKKLNWSDKIFQTGSHERFGQELKALGKLSSSNVMIPLAYVLTEDSAYLFYEHVHKGNVFDFLHKGPENALGWVSRHSIALGVAQGLAFLHGCAQPVLLLDLTTKSIHLKSMKEPQIGDIELCKVIDPTKSTGSLSTVAGSVGYIPPEYAYTMRVTMASNVYSFGVVLLELLTGKPPVSEGIELAKWALSYSARLNEWEQILDPRISKTSLAVRSQMLSVLKVALQCVSVSPATRPKMRNVLRMLFNAR